MALLALALLVLLAGWGLMALREQGPPEPLLAEIEQLKARGRADATAQADLERRAREQAAEIEQLKARGRADATAQADLERRAREQAAEIEQLKARGRADATAQADLERRAREQAAEIEQLKARGRADATTQADLERRAREQAAEIEQLKAREQGEATLLAAIERLKSQLAALERATVAVPSPAPGARPDTPADPAIAEVALGLTPARIRDLQAALRSSGHDPRGVDGSLGPGTRAAIRSWQRARGIAETGYISPEMLRMLLEGSAPAAAATPAAPATPAPPEQGVAASPAPEKPPEPQRITLRSFRDCLDCPEMMVVPAGSARLASGRDVTIAAPLAIGRFEITFEEWDACVAATGWFATTGCRHRPSSNGWTREKRPVIDVSWDDATSYLAWLSQKTGKPYRLLSEAEWEYAAQAGAAREGTVARGAGQANCEGCGSAWDGRQTAPVGSFPANSMGLHDLLGNVWEWTSGCWYDTQAKAPADGNENAGNECKSRVFRGGSWANSPEDARSVSRLFAAPSYRGPLLGFRVARPL